MIKKVVKRFKLNDPAADKTALEHWLSRTPEERVGAVETLRRRMHGDSGRLQRVLRVIERS
jgi:hypothetical protein